MIDLKSLYGQRYRITLDESAEITGQTKAERLWLYRIPCKYGHIYVHGKTTVGAYCDHPRIFARLLGIPGVKAHEHGDTELRVTFNPEILEKVAQLLQAKERRKLSEDQRQALRERMAAIRARNALVD